MSTCADLIQKVNSSQSLRIKLININTMQSELLTHRQEGNPAPSCFPAAVHTGPSISFSHTTIGSAGKVIQPWIYPLGLVTQMILMELEMDLVGEKKKSILTGGTHMHKYTQPVQQSTKKPAQCCQPLINFIDLLMDL